jgi:hypothetical protein
MKKRTYVGAPCRIGSTGCKNQIAEGCVVTRFNKTSSTFFSCNGRPLLAHNGVGFALTAGGGVGTLSGLSFNLVVGVAISNCSLLSMPKAMVDIG